MEKNNKIVKKSEIFARLLNCAILFRAFFFLYSFASFAYWFYKILNSNKDLPNSIKMILDLVFFVKEEDSIGISLPLLIIASFALLFGFFMDFCINHLYQKIDILQEEEANELLLRKMERQKAKEKRRQRFEEEQRRLSSHQNMSPNMPNMQSMQDNNDLQMGEMTEAQENAMFEMPTIDLVQNVKNLKYVDLDNVHLLFLVEPRICKIKKNKEDVDLTFEKLELWKKELIRVF